MGPLAGSRLESVNARLGTSILVGDATYQQAKEAMSLSSLGTWAGGRDHTTNRLKRKLATEPVYGVRGSPHLRQDTMGSSG